jgi:pyruvate formate-lyase/glycerol dehydratase family glycyl radical enzyme
VHPDEEETMSGIITERERDSRTPAVQHRSEHVLAPGTVGYERGQFLRKRVITVDPRICIERARLVTQSYRETENQPVLIRRAKAFDRILRGISVYILDRELVVGHQASSQRSAPLYPEFAVEWVEQEIDSFGTREQDRFIVTPEVRREFLEEILPYWKGRTLTDHLMAHLTEEIRLQRFVATVFSVGLHEDGGLGHVALDYRKVLTLGLEGIKEEIRGKMDDLLLWKPEDYRRKLFYDSALMMCDSAIAFAGRSADTARRMAEVSPDEKRREELRAIAAVCDRVPQHPARSFHEALQSFWFVQLLPQIYDNGVSISPGRFDQYMYPYYAGDLASGKLTPEEAQELLEACWVKFTEPIKVYRAADAAFHAGYPMGQNLCVGGVAPDGLDATNDLSYRCLESHSHMLLMQPNFTARVHQNSPHEYLRAVAEAIKLGSGMPQITNDDVFVTALTGIGVPIEEAREYVPVGCVENAPVNTWGRSNGGYTNLTKVLELALNDGVCRITGQQVGPRTGDPRTFTSFDDLIRAYSEQMRHSIRSLATWDNLIDMTHAELMPTPFVSIVVGDCILKGKDVTEGGARYNWTGPLGVGIANAGDSLYAVKKMVFDERKLTMQELIDALDSDFEGREDLRQILLNKVEKYGNDVPEADLMVKRATDIFLDELKNYRTYRGGPFVGSLLPVASYVAFGMSTGATPDGRRSRERLADGISPTAGMDHKGPTAVFKSVCTIDHRRCPNGVIFNQKINPSTISTREGLIKFVDLIRTYLQLGGGHIQFNIVSADVLKDAQKNPEKHRGLVVRVAGYSAFFHELHHDVQDSIIARTEQEL